MHNIQASVTWVANYYSFYHTKLHFVCCIIIRLLRCILTFSRICLWLGCGRLLVIICTTFWIAMWLTVSVDVNPCSKPTTIHNGGHCITTINYTRFRGSSLTQTVSQSLKSEWLSPLEPQKQKKSGRVVSWLQDESLVGSPALLVPHSSPCRRRRRSQVTIWAFLSVTE